MSQLLTAYMHNHRIEGWEAGGRVLVLLDNTPASEVAVRRAWRLAHAFETSLIASYPEALSSDAEMRRILTVARDLNAEIRALPDRAIVDRLDELIADAHVSHITLLSETSRPFSLGRNRVADQLLARHPHLDLHLVNRSGG